MSFGDYALGVVGVAVIAVSLGTGARRARGAVVPTWTGAPARLAEVVIASSGLLVLAQLLGIAGVMTGVALTIGSVVLGGLALLLIPLSPRPAADPGPSSEPTSSPAMTAIAIAIALIVVAHWAIGALVSLDYGIFNADDLQSHLPTAARFAQDGSIAHLVYATPSFLVWLYPDNSELFQAIGMTLFDGDFTAPLLNLAWVALTLLAAWCFGRRFGAAPQTMTAAALLLDTPLMIATQAGTSKNDTLILAFFASALALLVNGAAAARGGNGPLRLPDRPIEPGALALAGLATGFAAGTKFSLVVMAGVLAAGLVWIAPAGTRVRTAALFVLPALVTGGFWYLRNLIDAGNPLPWVDEVGPVTLPGLHQSLNQAPHLFSVGGRLTDTDAWSDSFAPGFSDELGPLWPLVLALAGTGLVWGLLARGAASVRVIAAAGIAAVAVFLALPLGSVDESGDLVGFAYALRHLTPALLFGLLLVASLATRLGHRAAWLTLASFSVLVLFFTRRALDFWEGTGHLAGAVLIAASLIAVPVAAVALSRSGGPARLVGAALAAAAAAVVLIAGWPQARDYADARYRTELPESVYERFQLDRNITPLLPLYRWAQDVHDARIGTSAVLQYGLYDDELTNHVQYVGVTGPNAGFDIARNCEAWRQAVNRGNYDYVVAAPRYGGTRVPQTEWTAEPGVAQVIFRSGPVTVFRIGGELDPAACE
jgi:hypothetical protein